MGYLHRGRDRWGSLSEAQTPAEVAIGSADFIVSAVSLFVLSSSSSSSSSCSVPLSWLSFSSLPLFSPPHFIIEMRNYKKKGRRGTFNCAMKIPFRIESRHMAAVQWPLRRLERQLERLRK